MRTEAKVFVLFHSAGHGHPVLSPIPVGGSDAKGFNSQDAGAFSS